MMVMVMMMVVVTMGSRSDPDMNARAMMVMMMVVPDHNLGGSEATSHCAEVSSRGCAARSEISMGHSLRAPSMVEYPASREL
jgi:hypothetical protein